jgi:HNH endonuclease/NUMOD4 motif
MTKRKDPLGIKKIVIPPLRATIKFKAYPKEIWKEFKVEGAKRRYMASNMGRIASFYIDVNIDGYILKVSRKSRMGDASIGLKVYSKGDRISKWGEPISEIKCITLPVHKVIAEAFLEPKTEDQVQVIHLDHDKFNNDVSNLRWATKDEAWLHFKKSEFYKEPVRGQKLTIDRVRLIKRKIAEGKTKQGLLAKQFGLSEMGIYRIKTGKNWGHVKI